MNEALGSAHSFVRALKAPSDPPQENWPTKVRLAKAAWENSSTCIPRKAGIILEWLLPSLTRNKQNVDSEFQPILSPLHWEILADVLSNPGDTPIIPIISRFSVASSLRTIFLACRSLSPDTANALFAQINRSLAILWPLSTHNLDILSEAFWASISLITDFPHSLFNSRVTETISLLWRTFQENFELAFPNQKKKIYTLLSQHINDWLLALQSDVQGISTEQVYQIGRDILYNMDSLRAMLEAKQSTPLLLPSVLLNDQSRSSQPCRRSLLRKLPCLYKDFLTSVHNHQHVILPSSLNAAQVRERLAETGISFAMQIIRYLEKLEGLEDDAQLWNVILDILIIVEQTEITVVKDGTEWMLHLCDLRQRCLSLMNNCWDEKRAPLLGHVLDVLSFLHRVEPELIHPVSADILQRIALSSSSLSRSASTFLKQLLSFYSKTRTLHTFLTLLQDVLKCSFPLVSNMSPQKIHEITICSPMMSFTFLDELRHALLTYISPGQAKAIIESVGVALRGCVEGYAKHMPSVKRRKLSENLDPIPVEAREVEMDIVAFCLVTRLDSVILETLSRRNMLDYAQDLASCLDALDGCISTALNQLFPLLRNHTLNEPASSRKRKRTEISFNWSDQCFFALLLQLSYNLFTQGGQDNGWEAMTAIFNYADVMIAFMKKDMTPELQLETGRWLMYTGCGIDELDSRVDALLDYIEQHGSSPIDNLDEKGFSYLYSARHVAFVLLGFLLESRLPTINAFASQNQLKRIARLLLRQMARSLQPKNPLSMEIVINRLCQTASFWEMQGIKTTLQVALEEETSCLTSMHGLIRPGMDRSTLTQSIQCSPKDLEYNANIYNFLLRFPSNYLSKKSRDELLLKALNADVFIKISHSHKSSAAFNSELGVSFRTFLSKCWNEHPSKLMEEIASDPSWLGYVFGERFQGENCFLRESSNGVRVALLKSALGCALKGEPSSLDVILNTLLNLELKADNLNDSLIHLPLILTVNAIIDSVEKTRLTGSTVSLLDKLGARLGHFLETAIQHLLQEDNATLFSSRGVINGWKTFLALSAWTLGKSANSSTASITQRLFRRIISSRNASSDAVELHSDALSIALLQNKLSGKNGASGLAEILAGYLLVSSARTSHACDEPLRRFCKTSTLDQYEMLLGILGEYLEKPPSKFMLATALHASILFLKEAPEKSSKISSPYVSRCLRVLTNTDLSQSPSSGICKVFEFLHFQCSERAVTLTMLDVGEVLTIIHSLTNGSREHDTHTSYSAFDTMVSTLDNLVRLRHDLLNSFFPHISKILRRLILLTRTVRPQLGTKQYRFTANGYPRWVNPSDSLGPSEAKTLARLLTMFTTKTSVRSRGSDELPGATSLARSFARHAPYVLLAYLQAVSDPLAFISAQVRKELQPGLFALCSMTGEHGRDTLMVQVLNAEQQVLLKVLWGDYVKQKYTGKG